MFCRAERIDPVSLPRTYRDTQLLYLDWKCFTVNLPRKRGFYGDLVRSIPRRRDFVVMQGGCVRETRTTRTVPGALVRKRKKKNRENETPQLLPKDLFALVAPVKLSKNAQKLPCYAGRAKCISVFVRACVRASSGDRCRTVTMPPRSFRESLV